MTSEEQKEQNYFINEFEKRIEYFSETSEHWAEIKTSTFPQQIIIFNLAFIGFIGAVFERTNQILSISSILFGTLSAITSFIFAKKVISTNIESLNKRRSITEEELEKLIKNGLPQNSDYGEKMKLALRDLSIKEKKYNIFERASGVLLFTSYIFGVLSMVLYTETISQKQKAPDVYLTPQVQMQYCSTQEF